ncbi:MAG: hypothetical protein AAFW74_13555, partial [Pseudomonadota bacterium]
MTTNPRHNLRDVYPDTGADITTKSWLTEAPMRMLMNNLHPDVAENPHELVVYGGIGRATRTWDDFDRIVASLKTLEDDETLLVQSGKPVGVFRTHTDAPRVLIANSNLVPEWANWKHFNEPAVIWPYIIRPLRSSSLKCFQLTHTDAPRVLIANSNLVPEWA